MQEHAASDAVPVAFASTPGDPVRAVHAGAVLPEFRPALDAAPALARHLVRARLVSARMVALQRSERIGFHASSIGEEAAVVGAVAAMRPDDWVFPGAREWYAALLRGLPLARYVHHVFGSAEDPAKGHAAPDHLPARAVHVVPPSGIPSAHLPQAVGAAWAARINGDAVATLALFGGEVAEAGDFHNALNFAGVVRAPVIFVGRSSVSGPRRGLADRAVAYGLGSARVDGGDLLAVFAVVKAALARAVEGKGATLVEVVSQREQLLDRATSLGDAAFSSGDMLDLGEEDPLVRLRRVLVAEKLVDEAWFATVAADTTAEIDAAVAQAEAAGPPAVATIFDDVYAGVPAHLAAERQRAIGG